MDRRAHVRKADMPTASARQTSPVQQVQVLMCDPAADAKAVLEFIDRFHLAECRIAVAWRALHQQLEHFVGTGNWDAVRARLRSRVVLKHHWTFPAIEQLMRQQHQLRRRLTALAKVWCRTDNRRPCAHVTTLAQVDVALAELGAMRLRASKRVTRLHQLLLRKLRSVRERLRTDCNAPPPSAIDALCERVEQQLQPGQFWMVTHPPKPMVGVA